MSRRAIGIDPSWFTPISAMTYGGVEVPMSRPPIRICRIAVLLRRTRKQRLKRREHTRPAVPEIPLRHACPHRGTLAGVADQPLDGRHNRIIADRVGPPEIREAVVGAGERVRLL